MFKFLSFFILSLFCLLAGCRREDIRLAQIQLPEATAADLERMKLAFVIPGPRGMRDARVADGILLETLEFDADSKTLSIKYDSMKIACTNIRVKLEKAGLKVVFPSNNPNGVAGYVDFKPASVQ